MKQTPTISLIEKTAQEIEAERRFSIKLNREMGSLILGLMDDPAVVEIMLNDDGTIWSEKIGSECEYVGNMQASTAQSLIGTVAAYLKTVCNKDNPILECELPFDGSRFEALVPPVVTAPVFTIRKKATHIFTLENYVEKGIMSEAQHQTIIEAIKSRQNILVSGGTGSGKTTLVNGIIDAMTKVSPDHRVVIIEDTGELQCSAKNSVTLRSSEQIDMTRLLKATMRLRPDRILVGEVRDGAALALLKAWNTGHPGGAATVHANSAPAALVRISQLVAEATAADNQHDLISEAVNVVVQISKTANGRVIEDVVRVDGHNGQTYLTTSI